jgi:2-haloacid dehalogenase
MTVASLGRIRALTFDVFGTLTDWRESIIREGRALGISLGVDIDWEAFADAWRAGYGPAMRQVEAGELPRQTIDQIHRRILDGLVQRYGVDGFDEATCEHLNLAWHRLELWPDVKPGLERLHGHYLLAPFSNANVSLLSDLSQRSGLKWDALLSAELLGHFKPHPEAYRAALRELGLAPSQVLMVAAHNGDLKGAMGEGYRAAFVYRTIEYGPRQTTDLRPDPEVDLAVRGLDELADALRV